MMEFNKDAELLYLNATDKVYISELSINGSRADKANPKLRFDAPNWVIKDCVVENGCTAYNVFEQAYGENFRPIKSIKVSGLKVIDPSLLHNVLSAYTFADDATIEVCDSEFSLTVDNSNILRLSNLTNASNVTVKFKNIKWTYEDSTSKNTPEWAGIVLYQGCGTDVTTADGDFSKLKTWKFIFEDCYYNGEKVTENKEGLNHLIIFYVDKNKEFIDPTEKELNIEIK